LTDERDEHCDVDQPRPALVIRAHGIRASRAETIILTAFLVASQRLL
jgi:hypothetical protein